MWLKKLTINQLGLFLIERPDRSSGLPLFHRQGLYYTTHLFSSLIALQNTSRTWCQWHVHTQRRAAILHWCNQKPPAIRVNESFCLRYYFRLHTLIYGRSPGLLQSCLHGQPGSASPANVYLQRPTECVWAEVCVGGWRRCIVGWAASLNSIRPQICRRLLVPCN